MERYDVVVVGGGLAAIRSAVSAAKEGARVCLVTKTHLCSGASFYPGMEMVACQSSMNTQEADSQWLDEIMRTSCGMADRRLNEVYIRNIQDAVDRFPEMGIRNARRTDPKAACFAENMRPTYAWGNWPVIRPEVERTIGNLGITVRERTRLLSVLRDGNRVCGIACVADGRTETIAAPSVVMATGGFGRLYKHNLNTPDVSGDGQAIALLAGAALVNIEFLQFIPGFIRPAYKTVFREMSMPYICSYTQENGHDLFDGYPLGEEGRNECLRIRSTHGPFSVDTISRHFDIAMMRAIIDKDADGIWVRYKDSILKDDFTFIRPYVTWLRENKGVEIEKEKIMIAPFYHAANGGIHIDENCETEIRGLFACGEVSGGIHGANRQGGMSTGSCLVFGDIAGKSATSYARSHHCDQISHTAVMDELTAIYGDGTGKGNPDTVITEIQELMWKYASIVRNGETLSAAIRRIEELSEGFSAGNRITDIRTGESAITAQHMLILSRAVLTAMLHRRESRGAHYRIDYPARDESNYGKRFDVRYRAGEYFVSPEGSKTV